MRSRKNAASNSAPPEISLSPKATATSAILNVVVNSSANDETNAVFKTSKVAAEDFREVDFIFSAAASTLSKIFRVAAADKISLKSPFNFCISPQASEFFFATVLPIKYKRKGAIGKVASKIPAVGKSIEIATIKNIGNKIGIDAI